ncbi:unnamed protein product, partial [Iphiclides podalirius]
MGENIKSSELDGSKYSRQQLTPALTAMIRQVSLTSPVSYLKFLNGSARTVILKSSQTEATAIRIAKAGFTYQFLAGTSADSRRGLNAMDEILNAFNDF